jgi:hypothetical protein
VQAVYLIQGSKIKPPPQQTEKKKVNIENLLQKKKTNKQTNKQTNKTVNIGNIFLS